MSGSSSRIAISWADLPSELLDKISKFLDTETDARRFRAVCRSWRSSAPPVKKSTLTALKLPFPFTDGKAPHLNHDGAYLILTERTVYRLQPPNCRKPNFWLVKIEISKDGKSRLLNPVSDHEIKLLHETKMPKVLNTLDFRVSEVCKSYTLDYVNPSKPNKKYEYKLVKKVAVSAGADNDEYVIAAINYRAELWYIKSGDQKWTKVFDDPISRDFLEIVNYKGQFYGVNDVGEVYCFDSMFEGRSITYCEDYGACKGHLVELFDGELVLVDEYDHVGEGYCTALNISHKVRISRLGKRKKKWFETNKKFDGIIFLGDDCSFSFTAKEFKKGCKGTRVFYSDPYFCFRTEGDQNPHSPNFYDNGYCYNYFECYCCDPAHDTATIENFIPRDDVKLKFRGLHGHNTCVCDLGTLELGPVLQFPEYAKIFWPPPSWLRRRRS